MNRGPYATHRWQAIILLTIIGLFLFATAACTGGSSPTAAEPTDSDVERAVRPVTAEDLEVVTGQTLYVPAYSEIFSSDESTTYDLAVMLSVRNTDLDHPIIINAIQYYDTNGNLVRDYVESPLELAPMATMEVVISRQDKAGGTGANFIVKWGAEEAVHAPIVEALMTSLASQQGISFLSPARVLEETP